MSEIEQLRDFGPKIGALAEVGKKSLDNGEVLRAYALFGHIAQLGLEIFDAAQPKVTVNLPGDRTCTLHGADAEQFIIDHDLEHAEPGDHIDIGLSAPAGGK